jgi:DNA-3-methyladenine glycosylase
MNSILPADFYATDTVSLAQKLIGVRLVHETRGRRVSGTIVETEAYLRDDPACHASRGKTKRNAPMFGPAGHAYVYFIYGTYYCFNVVSEKEGVGEAVLIRALEPLEGIAQMQRSRGTRDLHALCSGPGKLVMALGITPKLSGCSLLRPPLYLARGDSIQPSEIVCTPRIGISTAQELPLRFYLKGSRFASRRCIYSRKQP